MKKIILLLFIIPLSVEAGNTITVSLSYLLSLEREVRRLKMENDTLWKAVIQQKAPSCIPEEPLVERG